MKKWLVIGNADAPVFMLLLVTFFAGILSITLPGNKQRADDPLFAAIPETSTGLVSFRADEEDTAEYFEKVMAEALKYQGNPYVWGDPHRNKDLIVQDCCNGLLQKWVFSFRGRLQINSKLRPGLVQMRRSLGIWSFSLVHTVIQPVCLMLEYMWEMERCITPTIRELDIRTLIGDTGPSIVLRLDE